MGYLMCVFFWYLASATLSAPAFILLLTIKVLLLFSKGAFQLHMMFNFLPPNSNLKHCSILIVKEAIQYFVAFYTVRAPFLINI